MDEDLALKKHFTNLTLTSVLPEVYHNVLKISTDYIIMIKNILSY